MAIITDSTVAQPAMLDQFRQHFVSNKTHLRAVDKFAKTYHSRQAAYWYTKDTFIHGFINETLRTGNLEGSSLSRLYITHLSEQIYQLKCQQQINSGDAAKNTVLYRGLRQSEIHLKILKNFLGKVILTRDFMSTTRDKNIALCFAGALHPQSVESQPLLIEIDVDMTAPDIIAADISHLSNFPQEQEVLFDIGSQFQVEYLEHDLSDEVWYYRLIAVSNRSEAIQLFEQSLSDEYSIDITTHSKDERLERIMRCERRKKFNSINNDRDSDYLWRNVPSVPWIAVSPHDRARILQQKALIHWQRTSNCHQFYFESKQAWEVSVQGNDGNIIPNSDTAFILNCYGFACQRLQMTDYAIDLFKQATEIRNRVGSSEPFRAQSLRNLGLAYTDKGDYENALAAFKQALILGQQFGPTTQWSTSFTLRNIAYFLHARGNYSQAAEFLVKALETFEECAKLCIKGGNI